MYAQEHGIFIRVGHKNFSVKNSEQVGRLERNYEVGDEAFSASRNEALLH